jgi:hypothetical protein
LYRNETVEEYEKKIVISSDICNTAGVNNYAEEFFKLMEIEWGSRAPYFAQQKKVRSSAET